jgi:hypothetical protein
MSHTTGPEFSGFCQIDKKEKHTMSSTTLGNVVSRLQDRLKSHQESEAVGLELKNARDGSEAQLRALQELQVEFGTHFELVAALDLEALTRAGIPITSQIDSARSWIADRKRWACHHQELLAWASAPRPKVALEDVVARIKAGATSASDLRARALKLSAELAKV